jgi:hypothetical protein
MTVYGINDDINHEAIKYEMLTAARCFREDEPALVGYSAQQMFRELKPALSLAVS